MELTKEVPAKRTPLEINIKDIAARIDELVEKKLAAEKLKPNAPVSDEVFLRRVYLDVIGRVPTKAEALAFLDSNEKGKRNKLITDLMKSDGYVQNWFNFWADLLRVKTGILPGGQGREAGAAYIQWIKDEIGRGGGSAVRRWRYSARRHRRDGDVAHSGNRRHLPELRGRRRAS